MKHPVHDSSSNSGNSYPQRPLYADGWDYKIYTDGSSDPHKLIKLFANMGPDQLGTELERYWRDEGGKAFGLKLCELVAARCSSLSVPSWLPVNIFSYRSGYVKTPIFLEEPNPIDEWLANNYYPTCIVRSSGYNEDWLDGRAGVKESSVCSSRMLKSRVRQQLETNTHLVVQEHISGIGCVFDIVYSAILGRNIVRVAAGGKSFIGGGVSWTSATWDNEAAMGLWDIEEKSWIIPFPEQHWLSKSIPDVIEELVSAIFSLPFDFGLQLELVVHPDLQDLWYLVQLRPSPDLVRGPRDVPKPAGKLIETTARVNKAGCAAGELLLVGYDRRGRANIEVWRCSSDAGRRENSLLSQAQWFNDLHKACEGKIVLWYHRGLDKYESVYQVRGVSRMGAIAQLGLQSLFINSAHGTSLPFSQDTKECWKDARSKSILMGGIDRKLYRQWVERVYKGETIRLHLVSDGIAGQIYEQ